MEWRPGIRSGAFRHGQTRRSASERRRCSCSYIEARAKPTTQYAHAWVRRTPDLPEIGGSTLPSKNFDSDVRILDCATRNLRIRPSAKSLLRERGRENLLSKRGVNGWLQGGKSGRTSTPIIGCYANRRIQPCADKATCSPKGGRVAGRGADPAGLRIRVSLVSFPVWSPGVRKNQSVSRELSDPEHFGEMCARLRELKRRYMLSWENIWDTYFFL